MRKEIFLEKLAIINDFKREFELGNKGSMAGFNEYTDRTDDEIKKNFSLRSLEK